MSPSGASASAAKIMPYINTENESKIVPISFFFWSRTNSSRTTPTSASTGTNAVGLRNCRNTRSLCIPVRESSHTVAVVPTFAPMISGIA